MLSKVMPFNTTVNNNGGQNSQNVAFKSNPALNTVDSFASNIKGEELYSRLVAARVPQSTIDEMVETQRKLTESFNDMFGSVFTR